MWIRPSESDIPDVHARLSVRRGVGAMLIAMLIALAQVGPALACAVFDGPGRPGCPALFHGAPVNLGAPAGKTDPEPDGAGSDCSTGPSYLVPDVEPPKVPAPLDSDTSVDAGLNVSAGDRDTADLCAATIAGHGPLSFIAGAHGRHIYLATRRLRI